MSPPGHRRTPLPALRRALDSPAPVDGFGARSPLEGLARRSVGFADILAQSLAAVAPTGVAITFPAIVLAQTGGATLLAALLAIIATLLVALCVNEFARRIAATGSLYTYVAKAIGPRAAYFTNLALQVGYGFISVFALASCGKYLALCWLRVMGAAPPTWALVLAVLLLGTAVVALIGVGIRVTLRILLVIEGLTAVAGLVLGVLLLLHLRHEIDLSLLDLSSATPKTVGAGAAIVMTAFVGFESSAALGAEAKRPYRDIPRALVWTVLGVGAFYFLSAAGQVAAYRSLSIDPAAGGSPANEIATAYGAQWLGLVLDLSVAVSFFACATASSTALVRVLFSLGREWVLPAQVGTSHRRLHTPVVAALITVPVVTGVPVVALLSGAGWTWVIETSLVVATIGYLGAYLMVCLATPALLWRLGEVTVRPVVLAGVAAVTLAGVLMFYISDEWANDARDGIVICGALLVGGLLYYVLRRRSVPDLASRIGVYDEPLAADVLGATTVASDEPTTSRG